MSTGKTIKKVAIVSCYFQKNYGSALQALATQKILDQFGVENLTIRYDGLESQIKRRKYLHYAKQLPNLRIVIGKLGYVKVSLKKKFSSTTLGDNLRIRDQVIESFQKCFRLSPRLNNFQELAEYVSGFDAVLVGSDQLWLPSNLDAGYYTLDWVPAGVKRISYGTSFGVSELPKKYYLMAAKFLSKIDALSVREETGQYIIKAVCGLDAVIVCDPTLMFTQEEWADTLGDEQPYPHRYIFCYFLGDNPEHRAFVRQLKQCTGYDIVAILHLNVYVASDEGFADYVPYSVDSAAFFNWIRYAEFVCTDSFHATVFSVLNKKKFFTFRRFKSNYVLQTNSRLDTFLGCVGLTERILQGDEDPELWIGKEIAYEPVMQEIEQMRLINRAFLKDALRK